MAALKLAAIARAGHEYQDLIGIQKLIDFYRNRTKYLWMQLESEDREMGYLDDVVAARADGTFDITQVKFTVDPTTYLLDWKWLLAKRPQGTSLLRKWATSVNDFELGVINVACLQTNRVPDSSFQSTLGADHKVDIDKLDPALKVKIEAEIGGAFLARRFFDTFRFLHSQPMLDELEDDLRTSLVPTDTDIPGWMTFRAQAKRWAMVKNLPAPDGRVTHQHLTQYITRDAPKPIPQGFEVPLGYKVPSQDFHDRFLARVTNKPELSVLWGTPGRGKSTYLSFLTEVLRKSKVPVVRHHYFLSLDDTTTDRFSFGEIAASLMDQILIHYPDAVKDKGLEEKPDQLPAWLKACGEYFTTKRQIFLVVVDGLDHVWRERRNLDHLNHLFENLIPLAPNVGLIIGTQRITDDKLPPRLLRKLKMKDWCEIPAMDEHSVQSWTRQQYRARRLRLRKRSKFSASIAEQVGAIGKALFQISRGHPLHLIYSFEALVRKGDYVDVEAVNLLPICPEGDINNCYALLWSKLSANARQIIHLIAGSDFHWPLDGLVKYFGQIDEVDFLLEHRRIGIVPFHGSILAFAREKANHNAVFRSLLPRIVSWLKKEAPPYWKWSWLWLMQAKSGDPGPLLRGATRDWAVNSIREGWPLEQIKLILQVAERIAFEAGDYAKTIEYRSTKTRISNADDYQTQDYGRLVECALVASNNMMMIDVVADGMGRQSDGGILTLSRAARILKPEVCEEARAELGRRINLWIALRHRPANEFLQLSRTFLEAVSLCDSIDTNRTIRFVQGFRDGSDIFRSYLACLIRNHRADALEDTYSSIDATKHPDWPRECLDAWLRAGTIESVDLTAALRSLSITELSPFASCWLQYHKVITQAPVKPASRPAKLSDSNPEFGRNLAVEGYLYDLFFWELSEGLRTPAPSSTIGTKPTDFIEQAIGLIIETARNIASGKSQLSFSTLYFAARIISPVDDRAYHDPSNSQYRGFKHAIRRIAVDLHLIKQPSGKFVPLSDDELATARSSKHWSEELWLDEQLETNIAILSRTQASASLATEIQYLDEHVTPFNERFEKWTVLARFALLYGLPEIDQIVRRAANCALGYGWRKDLWMNEVLDSIAEVHAAGAARGLPLLRQIAPAVDQITRFTDGDETDYCRIELIEVLARVAPDRLADVYAHHVENDEFRYAAVALEQHVKISRVDSPVTDALAKTFVENSDISLLKDLAEKSPVAQRMYDEQLAFVGGTPHKAERDSNGNQEGHSSAGTAPNVTRFKADEFGRLISKISDHKIGYDHQREATRNWLLHWEERGQGRRALKSIKEFFDQEDRTLAAENVLDLAYDVSGRLEGRKAAFHWLVQAQIHRHGWQSHWTSESEVMDRLGKAAKGHRSDWRRFIFETSAPATYWRRRGYAFSIGIKYLVRFLILVDQKQLAADFTKACVKIVLDEVSDQPLPSCSWFK